MLTAQAMLSGIYVKPEVTESSSAGFGFESENPRAQQKMNEAEITQGHGKQQ